MTNCIHTPEEKEQAEMDGLCPICLQQENEKLKKFARAIIKEVCWGYEELPDGGSTQDLAEKLGLIKSFVAGEDDVNPEFDDFEVGDTIYRFADILKENQ